MKNPALAIRKNEMWGPCFGKLELCAQNDDLNEEYSCVSMAEESIYEIPTNENGVNQLTN